MTARTPYARAPDPAMAARRRTNGGSSSAAPAAAAGAGRCGRGEIVERERDTMVTQRRDGGRPAAGSLPARRVVVDHHPGAARPLGGVHGDVGFAQQFCGIGTVGGHHHAADAGTPRCSVSQQQAEAPAVGQTGQLASGGLPLHLIEQSGALQRGGGRAGSSSTCTTTRKRSAWTAPLARRAMAGRTVWRSVAASSTSPDIAAGSTCRLCISQGPRAGSKGRLVKRASRWSRRALPDAMHRPNGP